MYERNVGETRDMGYLREGGICVRERGGNRYVCEGRNCQEQLGKRGSGDDRLSERRR